MHAKAQTIRPTRMINNRTVALVVLTVRRKLVELDEAYVFHAPIYTYIVFELLLWRYFQMISFSNLRVISENTFRGELILFNQNCSRNW